MAKSDEAPPVDDYGERSNIGDLLARYFHDCYAGKLMQEVQHTASRLKTSVHEVAGTLAATAISDEFLIFSRQLPGIAAPGKPLISSRYLNNVRAADQHQKIFLSYRRADSPGTTGRIFDALAEVFGIRNIFRDVDSMPLGPNFESHLHKVIPTCAVIVVLIGPDWKREDPQAATARIFEPSDPVRLEIEIALGAGVPIIPVLLPGARRPEAVALPPSITALCEQTFLSVRLNPRFASDMSQLIDAAVACSRTRSPLETLNFPELDRDSLIALRVVAAMGLQLHRTYQKIAGSSDRVFSAILDDPTLLQIDSAVNAWSHFIGNERVKAVDMSYLASVRDRLVELLTFTNERMSADIWQSMREEVKSSQGIAPTDDPSREELVAAAATSMLMEHYTFVRRSVRYPEAGDTFELNERLANAGSDENVFRVFLSHDGNQPDAMRERIIDALSSALAENLLLTRLRTRRTGTIPRLCNTLIVLIGPTFISSLADTATRQRLTAELAQAMKLNLRIAPVLISGASVPRLIELPTALQPLLLYTFSAIRDDPTYVNDVERLISFCRYQIFPSMRLGALALPHRVPLYATMAVNSLVRACYYLRNLIVAVGSKHVDAKHLTPDQVKALRAANLSVTNWSLFFGLLEAPDR